MTRTVAEPENEFGSLAQTAAAIGLDPHEVPPVQRKWVNISTGCYVSAVVWRTGQARLVLVPRPGDQARDLDRVALLLPVPLVVIDLPGSGGSSRPTAMPSKIACRAATAAWSFSPRARLIAGIGESVGTALAVAERLPAMRTVALVDADSGTAPTAQLAMTTAVGQLTFEGDPETSGAPDLATALLDIVNLGIVNRT